MMTLNGRATLVNPRSTFRSSDLHVVIPYSNHLRHQSRHRLMLETVEHLLNLGVALYVIELAHGDRRHVLQFPAEVTHIKIRATDIMWHKENQIDIGLRAAIANGAKYLAWIDGDLQFSNPHMATDTIEALQSWPIVQPWQQTADLDHQRNFVVDEKGRIFTESFCAVWAKQLMNGRGYSINGMSDFLDYYAAGTPFGHPGYAWACTTQIYLQLGGMLDWLITGSADHYMALGFAGLLPQAVTKLGKTIQPGYRRRVLEFQDLCDQYVKRNIGFVPGTVLHGWHGPKAKRGYLTRPRILELSKFDPDLDLVLDDQGLYCFARDNHLLRDGLRAYFLSREEDALPN